MLRWLGALILPCIMAAVEITIPLNDGKLVISEVQLIGPSRTKAVPELSFVITNHTSESWESITLQFDAEGDCEFASIAREWTAEVRLSLNHSTEAPYSTSYRRSIPSLLGEMNGCTVKDIKATLLFADNVNWRITTTGERIGKEARRREMEADRKAAEAERAAQAEQERIQAEAAATKAATESARQKRLAAERKKREAEAEAAYQRARTAEETKAAEERRRIRAVCALIHQSTANKNIADLIVKEEQQVRACQTLGLYPPR